MSAPDQYVGCTPTGGLMDKEIVECAMQAARDVLGQVVMNLLEADVPVTNVTMVDQLSKMFKNAH